MTEAMKAEYTAKLWIKVYVACIRSGKGSTTAGGAADRAVRDFDASFPVW